MFGKKKEEKITELQKIEYEHYSKHREYLVSQKHSMEGKFSQLLIYLSIAIFTISISLFRIYNFQNYICIILFSWFCSLSSLILTLFSFLYSIKAYNKEINVWDKTKKSSKENKYKDKMNSLINLGTFCLVMSIVLMFIFYLFNFTFMKNGKDTIPKSTEAVYIQKNSEPVNAGISPTEFFVDDGEDKK